MIISAIVAASENRVIGKDNDLPWSLPDDLQYFRDITTGHPIIMGRKNFESGPFPLPHRTNIVITKDPSLYLSGCFVTTDISSAIQIAEKREEEEIFIIGGGMIYSLAMPLLDRLYYTEVHTELSGDVFFPEFNPNEWKTISKEFHPKDDNHAFAFTYYVYERLRQ